VAGGRCEFGGCNRILIKHRLTQQYGNFGEVAHIVAFSPQGPRGITSLRPVDIHDPNNLMLLCPDCHKEIDQNPHKFSVALLQEFKAQHEQRIIFATSLTNHQRTAVVQLVARIDGQPSTISSAHIYDAIFPKYPLERPICQIDLNALSLTESESISVITGVIDNQIRNLVADNPYSEPIQHLSIFALAPIPAMVYLGYRLGNTIPADLYRHHRDTDNWQWQIRKPPSQFRHQLLRAGTDRAAVALLLSISGSVVIDSLPSEVDERFYIYEIAPVGIQPSTNCLKTLAELENFKCVYEEWRRIIFQPHYPLSTIHLFPAVPSPVAVLCGRELMPKVDPSLSVYSYDKSIGRFKFALEVNKL